MRLSGARWCGHGPIAYAFHARRSCTPFFRPTADFVMTNQHAFVPANAHRTVALRAGAPPRSCAPGALLLRSRHVDSFSRTPRFALRQYDAARTGEFVFSES